MKNLLVFSLLIVISLTNCNRKGCTDSRAENYSIKAKKNDGSCIYDTISGNENTSISVTRINYGSDERQHFDLYLPDVHNNQTKTVLLIHGGAWVIGPRHQDSVTNFNGGLGWDLTSKLLENGYAVATMKYRLACYTTNTSSFTGDPLYYVNLMRDDIDSAINKLKAEAPSLQISASHFALIGESAGAHLSLMYAFQNSSDNYLKTVISCYAPGLMDDQNFKNNTASAPFNNLPLSNDFGAPKYGNNCNFTNTGTVNLFWAVKSFVGANLSIASTTPSYTDTLSPAKVNNIERNMPYFIMHGDVDDLVPSNHADSIINAISTKFGTTPASAGDFNSIHKMKKYANCNHGWGGGSCNRTQMMDDIITWLGNHL